MWRSEGCFIHKYVGNWDMQWVSAGVIEGGIKVRIAMTRIFMGGMDVVSKILQDMVDFICRIGCFFSQTTPADHPC